MQLDVVLSRRPGAMLATMVDDRFECAAVVGGRSAYEHGIVAELLTSRPDWATATRRAPLPSCEEVQRLIGELRAQRPQLGGIVAVGGGATIDTAKLIAAFWHDPKLLPVWQDSDPLPPEGLAIAAIPTTAGSGSEATPFAAMYRDGVKMSADAPRLRPTSVVLAPAVCALPPLPQRAAAAADALSQALESIWSRGATPHSAAIAHAAFDLVWEATGSGLPKTEQGWTTLCRGAHFAGRAIAISRTTAAHALSYRLTHDHGVPHGQAVAVFLPALLALNLADPGRSWCPPQVLGREPSAAASRLADRFEAIGVAPSLHAAGFTDPGIAPVLAGAVNPDRLSRNPVRLTPSMLDALIRHQASPSWRIYGDARVETDSGDDAP